ncbi:MAG TPA: SIS domain-containing protein [Phaeodactylibacter sp.]|nr:SIS domain-containing protein [Phaeodactylibacter sp.]
MLDAIKNRIRQNILMKQEMLEDEVLLQVIADIVQVITETFRTGGKVLFCGNGGSAADAQHLAAELSGRYYLDRAPLYAEALHVNSSFLTAVANDYGYREVFARMVAAKAQRGDVLMAFSTSGNSENIIAAIRQARKEQMTVVGFTGATGGEMAKLCDYLIRMPSSDTPRIQEGHILVGHIICEQVEAAMFGE